jgi:HTH-type transcriptional regulator/antitoxin HigA
MMGTATLSSRYLELLREFPLRPIHSDEEHERAIEVVTSLAKRLSRLTPDERDYLDVLSDQVERYESAIYPEPDVAPHEMLRELIDNRMSTQTRIARDLGIQESVMSEYLSGKRKMGLKAVENFSRYFHVDPGLFIAEGH